MSYCHYRWANLLAGGTVCSLLLILPLPASKQQHLFAHIAWCASHQFFVFFCFLLAVSCTVSRTRHFRWRTHRQPKVRANASSRSKSLLSVLSSLSGIHLPSLPIADHYFTIIVITSYLIFYPPSTLQGRDGTLRVIFSSALAAERSHLPVVSVRHTLRLDSLPLSLPYSLLQIKNAKLTSAVVRRVYPTYLLPLLCPVMAVQ